MAYLKQPSISMLFRVSGMKAAAELTVTMREGADACKHGTMMHNMQNDAKRLAFTRTNKQ